MKTDLLKTVAFTLVAILFFGCVSSIEKRRYRKGYHFAHSNSVKTNPKEIGVQHQEELVKTVMALNPNENSPVSIEDSNLQEKKELVRGNAHHGHKKPSESTTHTVIIKARGISDIEKEAVATVVTSKAHESQKLNGLWYFLTLLFVPLFSKFKKANDIARWSQQNKSKSRALVVAGNTIGIGSGLGLGYMNVLNIEHWMLSIPAILSVTGYCLFNSRATGRKKMDRKRKAYGLLSLNGAFGALVLGTKLPGAENPFVNHPAANVFLTILALAGLALGTFLLMMLACNLACSGLEALAVVVGVLGGFGLLYLFGLAAAHIWEREKDTPESLRRKTWKAILILIGISFLLLLIGIVATAV